MGKRYRFQFQGSEGVLVKHLLKLSSTTAAAASVSTLSIVSMSARSP